MFDGSTKSKRGTDDERHMLSGHVRGNCAVSSSLLRRPHA